jgi:hypothetical protein
MNLHKDIDLLNRLLALQNRKYATVKDRMIYERGYLTGMLARAMSNDSGLKSDIIRLIKTLEDSKRK